LGYTKGAASQPLIYQTENDDEVRCYSHGSRSENTYHIKNGVVNSGGMKAKFLLHNLRRRRAFHKEFWGQIFTFDI
jgi:hypothetical protein